MKEKILIISFQSLTSNSGAGMAKVGYNLAQQFFTKDKLEAFIVSSKGKFNTPFPSKPVSKLSRYYLFLINKLERFLKPPSYLSRYAQELLFDIFCQNHIHCNLTKIVATTPYLFRTFSKAKKLGIPIYFIPGNPEDNWIERLVQSENLKFGINDIDAYTFRPRLNNYNKSISLVNHIITYTSILEESYKASSCAQKVIATRGILKPNQITITKERPPLGSIMKIGFLAHIVLLKGLQTLLDAWEGCQNFNMELHIGGAMDKNMQHLIHERYAHLKHIIFHGKVTNVPQFFSEISLFVCPSLVDGAPVTVYEAMQNKVAVIVSDNCGAKDVVVEGETGWIVPTGNVDALKEKILEAYQDQHRVFEMGLHAQTTISNYNTQTFYTNLKNIIEEKTLSI
ncbi:MAG: glycosyltransferase family 4 protein [Bacteroidetes bacterium]|nr:glycosyltransferase family 4 protein [Bacteroidota bacterium]